MKTIVSAVLVTVLAADFTLGGENMNIPRVYDTSFGRFAVVVTFPVTEKTKTSEHRSRHEQIVYPGGSTGLEPPDGVIPSLLYIMEINKVVYGVFHTLGDTHIASYEPEKGFVKFKTFEGLGMPVGKRRDVLALWGSRGVFLGLLFHSDGKWVARTLNKPLVPSEGSFFRAYPMFSGEKGVVSIREVKIKPILEFDLKSLAVTKP